VAHSIHSIWATNPSFTSNQPSLTGLHPVDPSHFSGSLPTPSQKNLETQLLCLYHNLTVHSLAKYTVNMTSARVRQKLTWIRRLQRRLSAVTAAQPLPHLSCLSCPLPCLPLIAIAPSNFSLRLSCRFRFVKPGPQINRSYHVGLPKKSN